MLPYSNTYNYSESFHFSKSLSSYVGNSVICEFIAF